MKIQCTKEELLTGLILTGNIVSEKQTIPILSNILIETKDNQILISATDLKIGMEYTFNTKVIEQGSITLPSKKITSIIRELPNQLITLSTDDKNIASIECGKSNFKVMGLPKDEFPTIPEITEKEIIIPQRKFKDIFRKTVFAISTDISRYILMGLYCKIKDKKLTFVATDCRRLSYISYELETEIPSEKEIIIPGKIVMELLKVLKDDEKENIAVIIGEKEISFKCENIKYVAQLIDGAYPDYKQVIPSEFNVELLLNKDEFYGIIKRASVLSDKGISRVRIDLKENKLNFSVKVPDFGEFKEDLDVQYAGDDISIGFNPLFIMDALKNIDEDEIKFKITDSTSMGIGRRAGVISTTDNFIYVIMPMDLE
jgi:DNA polymerase III subunit beta